MTVLWAGLILLCVFAYSTVGMTLFKTFGVRWEASMKSHCSWHSSCSSSDMHWWLPRLLCTLWPILAIGLFAKGPIGVSDNLARSIIDRLNRAEKVLASAREREMHAREREMRAREREIHIAELEQKVLES